MGNTRQPDFLWEFLVNLTLKDPSPSDKPVTQYGWSLTDDSVMVEI